MRFGELRPEFKQSGPFRPQVMTCIQGLFLGGASTEHMFGIDATIWGGMRTAGTILGRDREREVKDGALFVDESRLTEIADDWDPVLAPKPGSVICRAARRCPRVPDAATFQVWIGVSSAGSGSGPFDGLGGVGSLRQAQDAGIEGSPHLRPSARGSRFGREPAERVTTVTGASHHRAERVRARSAVTDAALVKEEP